MLKKLFWHELRASALVISITYAAIVLLAAMAAVTTLVLHMPVYGMISSGLLMLAGFAALTITYVVLVLRFARGLFGSEGYFWMTLPVSPEKLYLSRILTGTFWSVLSSLFCTGAYIFSLWLMVKNPQADLDLGLQAYLEMLTPGFGAIVFVLLLFSQIIFMASIYFSITVSNIHPFQTLGAGAAVLTYIAYYIVSQILNLLASLFIPLSVQFIPQQGWVVQNVSMYQNLQSLLFENASEASQCPPFGFAGFFAELILLFFLVFFTLRMLRRKVNLR